MNKNPYLSVVYLIKQAASKITEYNQNTALQAGGRWFEPSTSHSDNQALTKRNLVSAFLFAYILHTRELYLGFFILLLLPIVKGSPPTHAPPVHTEEYEILSLTEQHLEWSTVYEDVDYTKAGVSKKAAKAIYTEVSKR
jgi:hypothetical protein